MVTGCWCCGHECMFCDDHSCENCWCAECKIAECPGCCGCDDCILTARGAYTPDGMARTPHGGG